MKHLDVVQRHKEHFLEINMFILKLMQIIEIIAEDVKELLWTKKNTRKSKAITTPAQEKALKHMPSAYGL